MDRSTTNRKRFSLLIARITLRNTNQPKKESIKKLQPTQTTQPRDKLLKNKKKTQKIGSCCLAFSLFRQVTFFFKFFSKNPTKKCPTKKISPTTFKCLTTTDFLPSGNLKSDSITILAFFLTASWEPHDLVLILPCNIYHVSSRSRRKLSYCIWWKCYCT